MKPFVAGVLCFILGVLVVPAVIFAYIDYGHPPVAVADPSMPFEAQIVHKPLSKRIDAEMAQPTIQPSPAVFLAGAQVYAQNCAFCHGVPGTPAAVGKNMYPSVPQLWQKHRNGVVGVSDDPPGATYWRVKNGIRLTGMPSYVKQLNDEQMWQVSLLLANADKPMPDDVNTALMAH